MTWVKVGNLHMPNDPAIGATVGVYPITANAAALVSGNTGRWGTVNLNLTDINNGAYILRITPANTTTEGVGPAVASTGPIPARIFRSIDIIIYITQHDITDVNVTVAQMVNGSASRGGPEIRVIVNLMPVWMQSGNHNSRGSTTIDTIVIHHTGIKVTSSAVNTFMSGGTSAHYIIDTQGRIIKMVQDTRRAWHAGSSLWRGTSGINSSSIGIEIVHTGQTDSYPAVQLTSLIALIGRLRVAYDTIETRNIIGHSDIATSNNVLSRKSGDPGTQFNWQQLENNCYGMIPGAATNVAATKYDNYFTTFTGDSLRNDDNDAQHRLGGTVRANYTGNPVTEVQQDLATIGYSVGVANGQYGRRTANAVKMFQQHFFADGRGGQANGRVDNATAIMIKRVLAGVD
ncbi:MAG: hypothetical protein GQ582_01215 [Methyloprofundus sp.]|nr:hypothetical protein [Methyloprofundus sp.]